MPILTDTSSYPTFASKAALLAELVTISNGSTGKVLPSERLTELVWRLSNTNSAFWADGTARHDD